MKQDLERLKQRLPLLEYLQQHHWTLSVANYKIGLNSGVF